MSVWLDYLPTCVCMCVCMRDTANISMINTQHTTLPVKDWTVYFSWTQNKAHGHYLQLCTVYVCVCVCVLACVWVCQGRLSSESSVDAFTGRQWADASWEEETMAFVVRALWLWGLSHRSSGGSSSLGVCMCVCVHKEEKQKHWSSTMCSSAFSVMLVLCRKEVEVEL